MSKILAAGGPDEVPHAAALIKTALHSCLRGEPLERERILALLAFAPTSDAALMLRQAARKAALALTRGRAYLWAALGVDYVPCPMNCAFCSLGKAWELIDAPRSYSETEIVRHAQTFARSGARFIVLRTTQLYDLDHGSAPCLAAIRRLCPAPANWS